MGPYTQMSPTLKKDPTLVVQRFNDLKNDLFLVQQCLKYRGKFEQDDFEIFERRRKRWWFTFKACICILLHRFKEGIFCSQPYETVVDIAMWNYQPVRGGLFNELPYYAGEWDQLDVARHSWHVHVYRNANY